jgi:hypothetical protein
MEARQLLASFVVTDPANAGPGTLRDAIEQANMTTELDDITFNLAAGMETITLSSGLPAIQNPVTIDAGAANPDGSRKVAVVAGAGAAADAFVIVAGSSTIRGLAIGGFTGAAILLQGSSDNRVFNNLLGLDRTGLIQLGNGVGVSILGSAGNEIGEDSLDTRNGLHRQHGARQYHRPERDGRLGDPQRGWRRDPR